MSENQIVSLQNERPVPLPIRLYNKIGLRAKLDASSLIDTAVKRSGLREFGDEYWRAPFERLLIAIEEEARLHAWGRFITRERLIGLLMNRLRAQYFFSKNPEILEQELKPVTVITGLQRTGTTKLQRLLASDPRALSVSSWEALNPAPFIGQKADREDKRIAQARMSEKALRYMSPGFFAIHPVEHLSPEEEVLLLDISFLSTVPEATLMVPEYSAWLEKQDQCPAYEYMKKLLLLLQWQKGGNKNHWILKTPHHLEWLGTLVQVFPDAHIIHTHRDPLKTLPSFLSMAYHGMKIFSDEVSVEYVSKFWTNKNVYMVQRALEYRKSTSVNRYTDIYFEDVMKDPMMQLERVYNNNQWEWSAGVQNILSAKLNERDRHKYGVHRYSLSDFGLTTDEVKPLFADYCQCFNIPTEA